MIREFEEGDAEEGSALISAHSPWFSTAAGTLHRLLSLPPRAHRKLWVAEEDGRIVGWGDAEFDWTAAVPDVGGLWIVVHPDYRRRGIGGELYELAVRHLLEHGAKELRSWAEADGASFLAARGFVESRQERISGVDPRTVDTSRLDELPDGVRVAPLAELEDRSADVHAVYAEAASDMPSDHPETNIPLDEWIVETLGDPDLDRHASTVVLVDDRPAALSFLKVDAERRRGEHDLTGTARAYRRRGLARLAKLAVMRAAAQRGVVLVTTGNDSTNAAMLAINDELGFAPHAVETEWVKRPA